MPAAFDVPPAPRKPENNGSECGPSNMVVRVPQGASAAGYRQAHGIFHDPEISRDFHDREISPASSREHIPRELIWMPFRHNDILPVTDETRAKRVKSNDPPPENWHDHRNKTIGITGSSPSQEPL